MYLEKLSPDQSGNGFISEAAVAYSILRSYGIDDQVADLLERSLNCCTREVQLETALAQGPFMFKTDSQRRRIEDVLKCTFSDTTDPLKENSNLWAAGDLLSFNYLNHTITEEKDRMIEDAQVSYLLAALSLAFWSRSTVRRHARAISFVPMQEIAIRTASAGNWNELSDIAGEFAASQLAEEIYHSAKNWNFDLDLKLKKLINRLLETYIVMKNPDAVMEAALRIYRDIYGVDLRRLNPASKSSIA